VFDWLVHHDRKIERPDPTVQNALLLERGVQWGNRRAKKHSGCFLFERRFAVTVFSLGKRNGTVAMWIMESCKFCTFCTYKTRNAQHVNSSKGLSEGVLNSSWLQPHKAQPRRIAEIFTGMTPESPGHTRKLWSGTDTLLGVRDGRDSIETVSGMHRSSGYVGGVLEWNGLSTRGVHGRCDS
jgi:hypothetical protein